MRAFRDAAWVLLGALLGTATWFAFVDHPVVDATIAAVPFANLTIFAMLVGSLYGTRRASRTTH